MRWAGWLGTYEGMQAILIALLHTRENTFSPETLLLQGET